MSNFDVQLRALVEEWLKRGSDQNSMIEALYDEARRVGAIGFGSEAAHQQETA